MDKIWELFCKFSIIALILMMFNSILGDILFRVKYSFPKVSQITNEIINPFPEPVQIDIIDGKYIKYRGDHGLYALKPQAKYSISALVTAKNNNFWFRDIMRSKFDDVALLDLGLVWGELASDKKALYKHIKFSSKKTIGQARVLHYRWDGESPWDNSYITSHIAHTHMIPANPNVMGGLLQIKKNNVVKIDGYLVDIYTDKSELIAYTSLSRYDTNATSRGSGACEDMYVTRLQIGNKIYE